MTRFSIHRAVPTSLRISLVVLSGTLALTGCQKGDDAADDNQPAPIRTPVPTAAAAPARLLEIAADATTPAKRDAASPDKASADNRTAPPPPAQRATESRNSSASPPSRPPTAPPPPRARDRRPSTASRAVQRDIVLPTACRLGDASVAAGPYHARIAASANGDRIELLRDGAVVASELALTPRRQPTSASSGAWLWEDRRHEPAYRVYVQDGSRLSFVVLSPDGT